MTKRLASGWASMCWGWAFKDPGMNLHGAIMSLYGSRARLYGSSASPVEPQMKLSVAIIAKRPSQNFSLFFRAERLSFRPFYSRKTKRNDHHYQPYVKCSYDLILKYAFSNIWTPRLERMISCRNPTCAKFASPHIAGHDKVFLWRRVQ
jgi:hypothetical protein